MNYYYSDILMFFSPENRIKKQGKYSHVTQLASI